jgi:chemotaxis signal transduction protein
MGSGETSLAEAASGQVLTFRVGDKTYGIDSARVTEIRGWSAVARMPQSLPPAMGVLSVRGAIVPIIDLRLRFGLEFAEFSRMTVIIVLSLPTSQGAKECGIVVDGVLDLVDVAAHAVLPSALSMLDIDDLALPDRGLANPAGQNPAPERRKESRPWTESKTPTTPLWRSEAVRVAVEDAIWKDF